MFIVYPRQLLMRSIRPHCCGPDWQGLARWQKSFSSAPSSLSRYLHLSCFRSRTVLWDRTVDSLSDREDRAQDREEDREEDIWMNINRSSKPLMILLSLWSLWLKYLIFRLFRFRQVKPREISLSSLTVFIYSVQYFHKKISFSIIL